jgi:hypothetical protein
VVPSDPGFAYYRARNTVQHLKRKLEDLEKAEGWGEWRGTPLGEAAIAWSGAVREHRGSLAQAEHAGCGSATGCARGRRPRPTR